MKGQVTIFIVLGIILLLLGGLVYYLWGRTNKQDLTPGIEVTERTPVALTPVRSYVESCLAQTAAEGLQEAMQHGGYVNPTTLVNRNPSDYTEGNAIPLLPNSPVAYWWYNANRNNVLVPKLIEGMPPLCRQSRSDCPRSGQNSVEDQLDSYVEASMPDCLAGFTELQKQGFDITSSTMRSRVTIRQDGTAQAYIDMPLNIEYGGEKTKLTQFSATVPTRLYEFYGMALEVTSHEENTCFIERSTMEMVSYGSGIDRTAYPPPYEEKDGGRPIFWSSMDVQKHLTRDLSQHVRFLNALNTSGFSYPEPTCSGAYCNLKQAYIDNIIGVLPQLATYHDATVSFMFNPHWPYYFDITHRNGQIIAPVDERCKMGGLVGQLVCGLVNMVVETPYQFDYMISYPVLVDVSGADENGRTESFKFALEANIRGNKCFSSEVIRNTVSLGTSPICDEQNRQNNSITISVINKSDNHPIEGIEASFQLGEGAPACPLGSTNSSGMLTTFLPDAFGGAIMLEGDRYLTRYLDPATYANETVEMWPVLDVPFSLKVINASDIQPIWDAGPTGYLTKRDDVATMIGDGDTVIAQFTRIPQDPTFGDYSTFFVLDNETETDPLQLVPGIYDVDITLVRTIVNHTLVTEHDRICVRSDSHHSCAKKPISPTCGPDRGSSEAAFENSDCYIEGYYCNPGAGRFRSIDGACQTDEEILYNQTLMESFTNGGLRMDQDNGRWDTAQSYSDFTGGLTFYIFRAPVPYRHFQLDDLDIYINWTKDDRRLILPRFDQ